MKIDEALTDLSIQLKVKHRVGEEYAATAIQLGIEALKHIKEMRDNVRISPSMPLPGETEN